MAYATASGPLGIGNSNGIPVAGSTGTAWFGCLVRPDAPVLQYATAPPKGMTNPPQNPKVREALLKDIKEYGVALQAPSWSKAPVRCSPNAALALPVAANAPTGTLRKGQPAPSGQLSMAERRHGLLKKGTRTSRSMPQLDTTSPASRAAVSAAPARGSPLRGRRSHGESRSPLVTAGVILHQQEEVGSPVHSTSDASHRHSDGASDVGGHSEGTHSPHQSPFRGKLRRVVTEDDVHDGLEALRRQGRYHRASIEQRLKSGPNSGESDSLGTEPLKDPPSWSNDACYLARFHNQAMRHANPSRLEKLPVVEKKRRKKVEDDELKLSQSGLTGCQYPPDSSLRDLRHLRVTLFPPEPEVKESVRSTHDEKGEVVSRLKADLRISCLKKVRTADLG